MREEFWTARRNALATCAYMGMTIKEAMADTGLTRITVRKYADKYGIKFAETSDRVAERLRELAAAGHGRVEAAKAIGLQVHTVGRYARKFGIEFVHGLVGRDADRVDAMSAMYRSGQTLEQIGQTFGVTRERVRQILSKHARMTAKDGGQSVKAAIRAERKLRRRDARHLEKYGCTYAQRQELLAIGKRMRADGKTEYACPTRAFTNQRNNARIRGIEWNLSLWDWWQVWEASGKWSERGRGRDKYVMCRSGDTGAYEVGNVYIATLRHNSTVQPNNPYRKDHPDFERVAAERLNLGITKWRGCDVPGCDGKHYAHGICQRHYAQRRALLARAA